jgi:mono/diheme cytochrome c family protein
MEQSQKGNKFKVAVGILAFTAIALLGFGSAPWLSQAAEENATASQQAEPLKVAEEGNGEETKSEEPKPEEAKGEEGKGEETCCKPGDQTSPEELVKKIPPGGLHSPYPDYAKLAKEEDLAHQFRLPGCNECHGGTGGGGFCPALTQGVWFWGNTDDVLFRLVTLGSAALEKSGFERIQWGSVHGPMPPMGMTIKTADHLWKIIAFIRSINPPGANPPEKVVTPRMKEAAKP